MTLRTVSEAILAASLAAGTPATHRSVWETTVTQHGGETSKGEPRGNLFTTTATGYTNGYDWLAKAMGSGCSGTGTWARQSGAGFGVTATGITSLVGLPTAGQGLAGGIVVLYGSTNNSIVYGRISSNASTSVTVDQWYDATSTSGAAGTTPTGGTFYVLFLPGQAPAEWMAVTATTFTPSTADTTLSGELTSNGFSRAVGSWSHTAAASTYVLTYTWTATGTETINNEAQFGACNTTAGGVMPFESAEPSPPTLVSGDTLQNTVTVTL